MTKIQNYKEDVGALGYNERQNNLAIRIHAHKQFSNFNLESWIENNLDLKPGAMLLDLGCGNGNLFPIFSKKLGERGVIVGIDKSTELLSEAKNKNSMNRILLEWDMNGRMPFFDENFDYVISSFAIYYVNNVVEIVKEIKRVLCTYGKVFLIGPTDNNAKELYEFNEKVFGFGRDDKIDKRTNRLEKEFYPVLSAHFANVTIEKIPGKLIFPGRSEFLQYYTATLLFEESVKKCGFKLHVEALIPRGLSSIEVSKEMIILSGCKNG